MLDHNLTSVQPANLVDQAADTADNAIRSTQRATNGALDSLNHSVQELRGKAAPALNRATEQATAFAQRGADSVREATQHLREKAVRASDTTVNYVRDEPVKAMLIAAATGATLMALMSLLGHSRNRG